MKNERLNIAFNLLLWSWYIVPILLVMGNVRSTCYRLCFSIRPTVQLGELLYDMKEDDLYLARKKEMFDKSREYYG